MPVDDEDINRHSRGRLMIWEKDDANYGVSVVSNQKTVLIDNGGLHHEIAHHWEGFSRTSFTDIHI